MLTSQNYDELTEAVETAEEKQARENRLKAWKIRIKFKKIDNARIRPAAAVAAKTGTDEDTARLAELEAKAQALRAELATLTEVTS